MLDQLEKAAREATPGPWKVRKDVGLRGTDNDNVSTPEREIAGSHNHTPYIEPKNAAFIALANPETILALIARVRVAEAIVEKAQRFRSAAQANDYPQFPEVRDELFAALEAK